MPYLITDDQGLPKPQYESENGVLFEAQKGKEGATFSYTKEGHNETLGKTDDAETTNTVVGIFKATKTLLTAVKDTLAAIKVRTDSMPLKSDISSNVLGANTVYGSVSVDDTVRELRIGGTALTNRKVLQIFNVGTEPIYVGFSNSVTTANGVPVWGTQSLTLNLNPNLLVYAIAENTGAVRIVEG